MRLVQEVKEGALALASSHSSHSSFFSLPAASGAVSKTLVVNNLAFSATEEVLQSTFEKAVSIRIPQRDGRPKG